LEGLPLHVGELLARRGTLVRDAFEGVDELLHARDDQIDPGVTLQIVPVEATADVVRGDAVEDGGLGVIAVGPQVFRTEQGMGYEQELGLQDRELVREPLAALPALCSQIGLWTARGVQGLLFEWPRRVRLVLRELLNPEVLVEGKV